MAFYNKYTPDELLWLLLRAARGETVPELTTALNSLAKSERALTDLFFSKVIDQNTFNTPDYQRFRRLLVDWNAAHKTITASSTKMSDPRVMTNDDLDELFRSFGFNYSTSLKGPTSDPLTQKVNLFLDLVNLYKRKGTPQAIFEVLQYFGVTQVDIFEFFLQFDKARTLIFKGDVITGTTISPTSLIYPYDTLTATDPHWLLTEEQIRSLHQTLKVNLPSKTNYLGVRPVATADGPEFSIYSRLIQDQYYDYKFRGIDPPENAEISMIGEVHSLLELHLSTLYVFHKLYGVGSFGDQFICYDGTSTEVTDIISEYNTINVRPSSRIQREVLLRQYYDQFCRLTPRNFLQMPLDPETVLNEIDPTIIPSIDSVTASNYEILFSMLKDIANWIRNNVGYGFINFGFIIFGLDAFFSDLKQVINFFKPYRARLLFLEALQIKSPLFESINVEEKVEHYLEINVHDQIVADSHPCCVDNVDTIYGNDTTSEMCFDSTVSFHSREYFDCGSWFDIGAVTDNNREVFIEVDEIRDEFIKCQFDSTATMTHTIIESDTITNETLPLFMPSDSTSENFAEPGDSATVITTSGLGDFDYGGCFDNLHGFEVVYITIIQSSSSSSSSSSSAVELLGGTIVWGQITTADEQNLYPLNSIWSVTDGIIDSTGDVETLLLNYNGVGESVIWNLGVGQAMLIIDKYQEGTSGNDIREIRTAATQVECQSASYVQLIGTPNFYSLGYVQVRITYPSSSSSSSSSSTSSSSSSSSSLSNTYVEDSTLSFKTYGNSDWTSQAVTYRTTPPALQSGVITHSQFTHLEWIAPVNGTLTFYWRVSSESNYDWLTLYVDNVQITRISGTVAFTQRSQAVTTGQVVRLTYSKDISMSSGSDCGWVDDFVWTPS